MIWEFSVFFLTLLYLGILWVAYSYPDNFFWPGLIYFLVLFGSAKIISKKYFHAVLPAMLALGTVLLLPLIDSPAQAKAFIVLSVGIFYLGILAGYRLGNYPKDQTAKAMYNLVAFSAIFSWFASLYGWYLNIEMPVWLIMIFFALIVFPVSYILLLINEVAPSRQQRILYSIFFSYLMAGIIWIQDFWPFGYLTTGVVALIIYYSAWDIVRNYFLGRLSFRKIVFGIVSLVGAVSIVLMSTKWYPVI